MKITAIYCRVAREDDDAIEQQETVLRNYAAEHGFDNLSVYADNGASGLSYNRPALSQLEADIRKGQIETVIVCSFDRIGRDILKTQRLIDNSRRKGVSFLSASEGFYDCHLEDISRYFCEMAQ